MSGVLGRMMPPAEKQRSDNSGTRRFVVAKGREREGET